MTRIDLTKTDKAYYSAKTTPEVTSFGPLRYLAFAGKGDPSSPGFAEAVQALYSTAYTLKFACKQQGRDFTVPKLEGQWWFEAGKYGKVRPEEAPRKIPRSEWMFRLLIRLPDFVTAEEVSNAQTLVQTKKGLPQAQFVSLFEMTEGKVVQMLHLGPFDTEPVSLALMMSLMEREGFQSNGLHHEIYLSDFRKTPPEKLRTILREPVK